MAVNGALNTAQKIEEMVNRVNNVQKAVSEINAAEGANEIGAIIATYASDLNLNLTDYNELDLHRKDEVHKAVFNSGIDYGNDASWIGYNFNNAVSRQKRFASTKVKNLIVVPEMGTYQFQWERLTGFSDYFSNNDQYEIFYVSTDELESDELVTKDTPGARKEVSIYANSSHSSIFTLPDGEYQAVIYLTDGNGGYSAPSDVITFTTHLQ